MADKQLDPPTFTPATAARRSGIDVHVIRDAIASGTLRGVRIGRSTKISGSELSKFVERVAQCVDLQEDFPKARRSAHPRTGAAAAPGRTIRMPSSDETLGFVQVLAELQRKISAKTNAA